MTAREPTVRKRIRDIQREVRETDLLPARAAELQNTLTSLLGNCNDEVRKTELAYKRTLLACLKEHAKANRARIEAETSLEYEHYREAKDTKDLTLELIRTLRQFLRNAADEMRLA